MLLNKELENSLDKQTLMEFLLYSRISYDWEIHPLHNKDWVKSTQEKEELKFKEFLEYKTKLIKSINQMEEKRFGFVISK
jgi:hypothetical protein